jgi:FtsZ-binding cell division protein ZapB
MDMMLKGQATSDQLKRDNALLSTEVNNWQARNESLANVVAEMLVEFGQAHSRTKKDLCNATETISGLRASEAALRDSNAVLAARVQHLERDNQALATQGQVRLDHPPLSIGVSQQIHGVQNTMLPVQTPWVRYDSDLYDWNAAKASGLFDFWSNNLHGSEIVQLLSFGTSQDHMVDCISQLIFDQESHGLVGWLTQRHWDYHREQQRLQIVHLLNDSMKHYGCTCHRVHI